MAPISISLGFDDLGARMELLAGKGQRKGVVRQRKSLLSLPASLLSIALTGQRLLDTEFLPGLQVKGVSLDFPDNVLLQDLPLEALERVLKRLAVLEPYLSQIAPPTLSMESPNTRKSAQGRVYCGSIPHRQQVAGCYFFSPLAALAAVFSAFAAE